ncbi:MAG: hypothetical protein GX567_19375 [Clostridia bacterium]|nr:hypothetical protein [Clostridia bacterium]
MTIEKFKFTDYAQIRLANGIGLEHWNLRGGVLPVLMAMENGPFWTVRDGGEVLAIGGYWPLSERVCEVSFFPSEKFVVKPLGVYRALRNSVNNLKDVFNRVQLNCRDEACFVRFAKSLGFEEEGRMRGFGRDGIDHLMMSIVRQA